MLRPRSSIIQSDAEGFTRPAEFATIEHVKSVPPLLNVPRSVQTPYENKPANRILPRKRYVIMPPKPGQKSHIFPGVHHLKQLKQSTSTAYQKRIIQEINVPRQIEQSVDMDLGIRITRPFPNTRYVLRIPKKEIPDESNKTSLFVPSETSEITKKIQHIPTVPPSMSMGGEYALDEFDVVDDVDHLTVTASSETSYFTSTVRRKDNERFLCPEVNCFWRGPTQTALRRHMAGTHKKIKNSALGMDGINSETNRIVKPKGVKCSECNAMAYSRPLLLRHMSKVHGIEAPLIYKTFQSRDQLQGWLEKLRDTHAVEFVVSSGSKKWGQGLQVHYLICSRSGDQKERPNKKFIRPPRPSIKCGKNCMAYLKMKQNPTISELQIEGCLHHSGHEIDASKIELEHQEWHRIGLVAQQYEMGTLQLDVNNMRPIRDLLGSSGRFRLMTDAGLCEHLPKWILQLTGRTDVLSGDEDIKGRDNFMTYHHQRKGDNRFEVETFDLLSDDMILNYDYESDDSGSVNVDVQG